MFVSTEFDVFNVSGSRALPAGPPTHETPYGQQLVRLPSGQAISTVRKALLR